jgi:hypothetical protein
MTNAGAINATILACGLVEGGHRGARHALAAAESVHSMPRPPFMLLDLVTRQFSPALIARSERDADASQWCRSRATT